MRIHTPDGFLHSKEVREIGNAIPVHGPGDQSDVDRVEDPVRTRRDERGRPWNMKKGTHQSPATYTKIAPYVGTPFYKGLREDSLILSEP